MTPPAAHRPWFKRLGWLILIWTLSVAALAVAALILRALMWAAGLRS